MLKPSFTDYSAKLNEALSAADQGVIIKLCERLLTLWKDGGQLFICGNGGSAGNAVHMANDFLYGIDRKSGKGLRAHALSSNISIVTCLANDEGYDEIYAKQLAVYANPEDVLIVLSGSGNSPNILKALEYANVSNIENFAILGYDGGIANETTQNAIHFPINDMQISEDLQTIVLHHTMQWLTCHADEIS